MTEYSSAKWRIFSILSSNIIDKCIIYGGNRLKQLEEKEWSDLEKKEIITQREKDKQSVKVRRGRP